jgi:GTP cyclohydrolase II
MPMRADDWVDIDIGIDVVDRRPLRVGETAHNRSYLQRNETRETRMGHIGHDEDAYAG